MSRPPQMSKLNPQNNPKLNRELEDILVFVESQELERTHHDLCSTVSAIEAESHCVVQLVHLTPAGRVNEV